MDTEKEELLTKLDNAMEMIEPWQKQLLVYHIENNFEERDKLLYDKVGVSYQVQRNNYINRLLNKLKELIETGDYVEKHKGNSKPTLKGF